MHVWPLRGCVTSSDAHTQTLRARCMVCAPSCCCRSCYCWERRSGLAEIDLRHRACVTGLATITRPGLSLKPRCSQQAIGYMYCAASQPVCHCPYLQAMLACTCASPAKHSYAMRACAHVAPSTWVGVWCRPWFCLVFAAVMSPSSQLLENSSFFLFNSF